MTTSPKILTSLENLNACHGIIFDSNYVFYKKYVGENEYVINLDEDEMFVFALLICESEGI